MENLTNNLTNLTSTILNRTADIKICSTNSSDTIKNCITSFIDSATKDWITFLMIVCVIIIVTEYFDIGITRFIFGKSSRSVSRAGFFPRTE